MSSKCTDDDNNGTGYDNSSECASTDTKRRGYNSHRSLDSHRREKKTLTVKKLQHGKPKKTSSASTKSPFGVVLTAHRRRDGGVASRCGKAHQRGAGVAAMAVIRGRAWSERMSMVLLSVVGVD